MRIILIVLILLFGVFTLAAEHDCEVDSESGSSSSPAASTTIPEPTALPEPTAMPESKFNCQDLELEYLNMSALGYETALMHVSNVMMLQDGGAFAFYTSGDAERELQNCGVIPR